MSTSRTSDAQSVRGGLRGGVRPAALAGRWYPADPAALRAAVQGYLATPTTLPSDGPVPSAVLVPHAGIAYSGPMAGAAWAVAARRTHIARVVIVGPAHRVPFAGIALGDYAAFALPTGPVPVDRAALATLEAAQLASFVPAAHVDEHCIEIQLPFMAEALSGRLCPIVPLLVGHVTQAALVAALELVLRPSDLLAVSSDLSHFHPYADAAQRDQATLARVVALDLAQPGLTGEDACGYQGLTAAMTLATRRGWRARLIGYQNSGDTAGDRREVVGYGAAVFGALP